MYSVYDVKETIRVPPSELGGSMKKKIIRIAREEYEGILDEDLGLVLSIIEIDHIEDGKVVPGDGSVYYPADIKMLVYKPRVHEVVNGMVSQIAEFGCFVRIGPMDGLVHVSQIMDDYINYNPKIPDFSGKETAKKLGMNDEVLSRIVSVSLKGSLTNSKIGLTMRQIGLGKTDWKKIEEKEKAKKNTVKNTVKKPEQKKEVKEKKVKK